jgi:hypothetical protein
MRGGTAALKNIGKSEGNKNEESAGFWKDAGFLGQKMILYGSQKGGQRQRTRKYIATDIGG